MQCDLTVGTPDTATRDGMLATTMRIVNAIPAVCAAAPGLVSSLDSAAHVAPDAFAS